MLRNIIKFKNKIIKQFGIDVKVMIYLKGLIAY